MVESEFKKNLSNQDKQIFQLVKSAIVDKDCMISGFGTGNLESLSVPDIHEKVVKFYNEKYSSNLMNVCITSCHTIDEIEKMAENHFGSIENKYKEVFSWPNYTDENPNFSKGNNRGLGHIYKVVPDKEVNKLMVVWPTLMPFEKYWSEKPNDYICNVIGHEGKDSFLSMLIE